MSDSHDLVLEISGESVERARLALRGQRFVVGRAPEADVRLDRPTVSRRHAEIFRDPFRRWWIRDLGSRNGTRVNDSAASEHVIHPGDLLTVGEFSLEVVAVGSPQGGTTDAVAVAADLAVSDTVARVSALHEIDSPRLSASHLSIVGEFAQGLLRIADSQQRLVELCQLMVREEFHGRSALVVRVARRDEEEPPRVLVPAQSAPQWTECSPYLSRSLLRILRERPEPLLASNAPLAASAATDISLSPEVLCLATLACPIRLDEQFLDALYVILPPEYGTGEWLALADLAVRQFQQADAAWAARRQEALHAAIERELEQARKIQTRLLPSTIHISEMDLAIGFKPCRWVGGDYVDVVRFADGRLLLVVADVCGKGLGAALVASSLHTTIRVAVRAGMNLPALMGHMNDYLRETLLEQSFVTMAGVLICPHSGELESVNAGHPPALVLAPGGNVRELRAAGTMPLGIAGEDFVCAADRLEPGELLVLFSDGVVDLPVSPGSYLGLKGWTEHLRELHASAAGTSAEAMAARLGELLDSLQGDGLSTDDRTFLLARRA